MPADSCRHQQSQRRKSVVRDSGSEEVVEELRKVTKEHNLKGKIRVVRSGC
jgi:hypothetical protein